MHTEGNDLLLTMYWKEPEKGAIKLTSYESIMQNLVSRVSINLQCPAHGNSWHLTYSTAQ